MCHNDVFSSGIKTQIPGGKASNLKHNKKFIGKTFVISGKSRTFVPLFWATHQAPLWWRASCDGELSGARLGTMLPRIVQYGVEFFLPEET